VITISAIVLFALKIIVDANFGHKALKEVRELKSAFLGKMDDHEKRITSLERP
jgi:hypothetical protein